MIKRSMKDKPLLIIIFFLLSTSCTRESALDLSDGLKGKIEIIRNTLSQYPPNITETQRAMLTKMTIEVVQELKKIETRRNEHLVNTTIGEIYRLGHNLDLKGAWNQSKLYLEKVIQKHPDYSRPYLELGFLLVTSDHKYALESEKLFKTALFLKTEDPYSAYNGLILASLYRGNFIEAEYYAKKCIYLNRKENAPKQMLKVAEKNIKYYGSRKKIQNNITIYRHKSLNFQLQYNPRWITTAIHENLENDTIVLNFNTPLILSNGKYIRNAVALKVQKSGKTLKEEFDQDILLLKRNNLVSTISAIGKSMIIHDALSFIYTKKDGDNLLYGEIHYIKKNDLLFRTILTSTEDSFEKGKEYFYQFLKSTTWELYYYGCN